MRRAKIVTNKHSNTNNLINFDYICVMTQNQTIVTMEKISKRMPKKPKPESENTDGPPGLVKLGDGVIERI